MGTRVSEIADGVHQLSTFVGAPVGWGGLAIVQTTGGALQAVALE